MSFWAQLCNLSAVQSKGFPFHLGRAAGILDHILVGWRTGHSGLHFPLVAGAPGRAEPAAGGTQGRAAVHDPRCCIWVFSKLAFLFSWNHLRV